MTSPAASIVLSVYNGERFLARAVQSILGQSMTDIELIVVDDGSTDTTPAILERYAAADPRMVVLHQANGGRAMARNRAFEEARAPVVAVLDADDVALPERLERQHRFLAHHPQVAAVGGGVRFVDEDGRAFPDVTYPLTDGEIRAALEDTTPLAHSAVMVRKEAWKRVGGYRPLFRLAEDTDLWLRIAEQAELANLPDIVVCYRIHPSQGSAQGVELQTLETIAARVSAQARAEGRKDPLDGLVRIDRATLSSLGVGHSEMAAVLVRHTCWLARTLARAGYPSASEALFATALDSARSATPSRTLVARVHRDRARTYATQGRRMRSKLEAARATLAEHR
jgi:GT2 family glycosyltransferase